MEFETFAKGDVGFHFGSTSEQALGRKEELKKDGKLEGEGRVIRGYLDIKNPIRISSDIMTWWPMNTALRLNADGVISEAQYNEIFKLELESGHEYNSSAAVELRRILEEKGYDGIVYENMFEADGESYIAFYPEQVIIIDNGKGNIQADSKESASFMPEIKALFTEEEQNGAQERVKNVAKLLDSELKVLFVDRNSVQLKGANGKFVRKTNTIFIARDASAAEMYVEVFKHEFIHRLETRRWYQSFKDYLYNKSSAFEKYARTQLKIINGAEFKGSREEALETLTEYYYGKYTTDEGIAEYIRNSFSKEEAKGEIVADFAGDVLFKGEKYKKDMSFALAEEEEGVLPAGDINSSIDALEELANTDRNLFQKVWDTIKDFINALMGRPQTENITADLEYLENRLKQVYDSADTKKAAKKAGGERYSLNVNAKSELHKALYDTNYRNEVLLRDETPPIMLSQKGVENRPMVMNASHIRENVFTEDEARKFGLKVDGDKHYHGLGEDFFLKIIDGLDNVKEAYRGTRYANKPSRGENYFLLVSEFKDQDGNTINVPVYIEEGAQCNRVYLTSNKIATVFGKEDFRSYINNQVKNKNLVRIKNKSNKISEGGVPLTPAYENIALTDNRVSQNEPTVKNNIFTESGNYSENDEGQRSIGSPMQKAKENFAKYERGEMTSEEYQESLDEVWGEANEKYGSFPTGEKAENPIAVPQAVSDNKNTERFIRTILYLINSTFYY